MGSKKWVNKVLTYLCQIANDNCHDDPINGNSFTKDNAKKKKKTNCHQVQMRAKKALGKQINLSYNTDGIIRTVFLHI